MNKKYIIEVATNPASLKKLKDDLQEATRLPKEGVEVPELSRETKAKVKKDLATLFGVADYQADALRSMVQAMTQGLTDDSSVQNMKTQLEQTLRFTTDIMESMQKMGKSTDWMKQGISFVDDFIKMKESIETVEGLEKSVTHLTQTFEVFKDALAETNMDAFLQRFGNSTKAEATILAKANKELQRVAKSRNEDLQKIMNEAQGEAPDFVGLSREDIEEEYKFAIQAIQKYNKEIEALRQKFQGRTEALYKDKDYKELIEKLYTQVNLIENMPGLNTEDIGRNLKASLQEATDSVKNAKNEIQKVVDGLKDTGIELAITLPDPTTAKFAAEINKFVKKANEEFKGHPIEMTLDVTSPFKKDAFKKDGTLKELSNKQKELSQSIEKTFRENLQTENIEIGEDDLKGLYNVNTNVIARNITDAFNKLYKSMTAGQALIKGATKKWRDTIEEDLTIKPKFYTDGVKQAITNAITEIETDMEGGEYDLTIYPNTEQLVSEIQGALKDPDNQFLIDVKVDNVDTSGVVLNVDSAQINSGGSIPFGFFPMQPVQQNTPPTPPSQSTPPAPESQTPKTTPKSTTDAPTKALTQNTNVVTEGTIAQRILTDAVNDLSQSLSTIDGRMKSVQDRISSVEQQREKNAKEIENNSKSIDSSKQRRETASVNKQSSQEKLERAKQDKANMENLISTINVELRNALKDGNIEGFNNRIKSIIDKDLPNVKKSLENQIGAIKKNAGMTDSVKETEIIKLTSFINDINRISNPNTDLTKATDKNGTKLYFTAVRLAYRDKLKALDEAIADIEKEVASRQKDYSNADIAVTNAHQRERELSGEDKEESAEKQLKKFKDEKGALESRKKKIQKVLDNNEDPVTLVLNEVAEYWKTSDKKIADAEAYISKSEVQLKKLEKELEGYEDKKSPEYKKKQKEYDEENARLHKDRKYVTSKNAIENWTANNAVMRAAGLDLKEMKSGNEIKEITRVLVENATLADALGKNKNLKGLANIKNLEYFIPKVQQTLGADSRSYEDYMSEQELRANFLEALKINEYIVAARQMLKAGDTDISPTDVQNFIDYFADIPDMAQAVSIARQYLEEVNKLPESTWEKDAQESYFDQFKNVWESLDKDSRRVFANAYSDSTQAHGILFNDFQNIDNKRFADILTAFNEDESSLKGLETDNKQLQQIIGILQRSSLLTSTKDISSQYGEHGILASLFGMQKSNLMGNKYAPKAPIYITTHDEKDREKIYELGAKGGRSQSSDGKFNFTPESFDRMIKKTNTADEMSDILSLIYDPLVLQNEKLEHKIRNLRTDLNALKTLDFSDDESTVDSKKKMRRLSYNALDGTDVERRWHRYKTLQGEIGSIKGALQSGLDNGVLPDVLWKNIKGLRKQRGLEKELRGLDNGEFSDDVKRQLKGLTDKEKEKKVKEIKAEKKTELEELKKQNVKDATKFLTDKVKEYLDLENKIIKQTDTTIAAKEKELEAAEKQHEKNAPVVAQRKREADEILQQMMESGKFKLSHGKGSVTPKWDQKYEYQDTELAKFEKRKEANDRTIEILKQQNEDDKKLLELLESNQTNDKIDEMLNGLSDKDKEKPKEAQLDLLKNKITAAMNHRDAEIERLSNITISLKDVIESIVVLEEDIERGKAKEKHESQLAGADKKRSKRVLKSNKKQFDSKKTAYQLALKREASQFNFNNQFATSKTASTQESQPEFTNLLSKIKLASDWNIFDTTKINEMVDEYLRLIEEAKTLAKSGTASDDDISKIEGSIREAQDKLVKEWFGTDNWYIVDLLESRFSVIDGQLRQAEQAIMSEASSTKATHDATESVLAEQKQKAHKLLEEYVSQLKAQYIDKPKEEVLSALNKEVKGINADTASVEAELQAVDSRADKALEEQRRNLVKEYQNDPLYKQLLEQRSKILNSEDYNIKDVNSEKYKASHIQANDITNRLHEIEIAYDQKFKELRDKWIADEREKILKSVTKDSYSKNAYKLKDAYDKRDKDLSTVHQRAQQDSGIAAIKEQVAKELQADEKYINLLQQYKQMSKAEQDSESGKKIYSQIQSIKQKYDQKIVDAINAWKNEEVGKINKAFDDTVSAIVNGVLRNKRSGIRNDQLSTLEEQKKAVIERLSRTNSEFSNLVNSVSTNLKEQLGDNPDVFQLSKELVNRGLPTDISFEDAFILSTDKIETGEQYKKYFARIQNVLLEQVGKMLQVMVDSADNPELVSEEEIKAQIEAKRVEATKKKREKVAEVKGKSARELLSDRYDDTAAEHFGKAAGIKKDRENLETKRDDIKKKYGVTDEMIKASRKGSLIVKVNAKKVETTATSQESPKQTQSTQKTQQTKQTSPTTTQQTAPFQFKPQQSSGLTYAPYGYVQAVIDTSDLAKEGTLRGIYEVLNGGAPNGGWDDSISEGSKVHENQGDASNASNVVEDKMFAQNIRNILDRLSTPTNNKVEEQVFADSFGKLLSIAQGENSRIPMTTWSTSLNAAKKQSKVAMDFHSHQNGDWAPSENDLKTFIERAYSLDKFATNDPIKILGTVGQGTNTGVSMDFNNIDQSVANAIQKRCVELYHKLVEDNPNLFAFDDNGKLALYNTTIADKDLLEQASQKMFDALHTAFAEFGYGDNVYKLTPDSVNQWSLQIQQAQEQISEAIVEGASESARQATEVSSDTAQDKLARIESELEVRKAKQQEITTKKEQINTEHDNIKEEMFGRKSKFIPLVNPDHMQEAYNESYGKGKTVIESIAGQNNKYSPIESDLAKALFQIARFPEKYGGIPLSMQEGSRLTGDNRTSSDAIIPLGNGKHVVFGVGKEQLGGHYTRSGQSTPYVFDDNGSSVGSSGGNYLPYEAIASSSNEIFRMSNKEMLELPIIQQALRDATEQMKEDGYVGSIIGRAKNETPEYIEAIKPLYNQSLSLEQEELLNQKEIERLTAEKQALEKEIGANVQPRQTPNIPTKPIQQVADAVIEAGTQAAVDSANTLVPTVSTQQVENAASQVANVAIEAGAQATIDSVNTISTPTVPTQQVETASTQVADAVIDTGSEAATDVANTMPTPEAPTQPIQEAVTQVTHDVIDTATEAAINTTDNMPQTNLDENLPTQNVDSVIGDDEPSDILSIYKSVFDKFDFKDNLGNRMNELIGRCRDYIEVQFSEGDLSDEVIGDLFKEADSGQLTIASKDLYKVRDIRNKIIDILLDSIDENFELHGFSELYKSNKSNIKEALESVIPNGNNSDKKSKKQPSKKKTTPNKNKPTEETPIQTNTTSAEKIAENTQNIEDANRAITSEQEQQSALSAEIAQNAEKAANAAQEKAQAEDKTTTSQKEQDNHTTNIDTSTQRSTTQSETSKHNYTLGLGGLAQEQTLKSILDKLSNGIKVTSDKKGGGGGNKGGKKKADDKPLNVTANDAWEVAQNHIKENYPNFTSLSALKPVSGGYSLDVFQPKNLKEFAAAQEKVNQLIAEGKRDTQEFSDAQAVLNGLKQEQEKITLRIGVLNDKVQVTQEKSGFQNLALGVKAASKELETVDGVLTQLHEIGALSIDADGNFIGSSGRVTKYLEDLKKLQNYQNQLSPEQLFDPTVNQNLSQFTLDLQNSRKEVMSLMKDISQLNVGTEIDTEKLVGGIEGLSDNNVKQLMQEIISESNTLEKTFGRLTPITNDFGDVIGYQLAYTVRVGKHEVQEMTAVLNPLTNELRVQKGAIKEVATGWEQFFSGLKGKAASIMQYLVSITSIQDIFRYVREGVQYVREIDSALTELKKVTDETDSSYARFLQDMSKTGSVIGATVSNLTTMAAEWARLGYSMKEAGALAESTAILLNVSEFEDATTASEALISTMQAFGYVAEDSQHVVDILNEVGKLIARR